MDDSSQIIKIMARPRCKLSLRNTLNNANYEIHKEEDYKNSIYPSPKNSSRASGE